MIGCWWRWAEDAGLGRLWLWRITSISTPLTTAHKALSAPCFLLLSLPWRSSGEMVPPLCISLPCAKPRAHMPCCCYVIIFPGSQKVTLATINWSGSHQSRRRLFNQSRLHGGPTSHASPFLCPQPHTECGLMTTERAYLDCTEAMRANCKHLTSPHSSTMWLSNAADKRSARCCSPPHRRPWGSCFNSLKGRPNNCPPRPAASNFVAHCTFYMHAGVYESMWTHSDMTSGELKINK